MQDIYRLQYKYNSHRQLVLDTYRKLFGVICFTYVTQGMIYKDLIHMSYTRGTNVRDGFLMVLFVHAAKMSSFVLLLLLSRIAERGKKSCCFSD